MEPHMTAPQATTARRNITPCNAAHIEPFAIYRAGTARNWYGSAPELARETGIALARVRKILRSRRWYLKPDTLHEETGEPLPVNLEFR
jgi:hypothetical protein